MNLKRELKVSAVGHEATAQFISMNDESQKRIERCSLFSIHAIF
jgi:hypothetical protein